MDRNWLYILAIMTLVLLRILVFNTHYDEWLAAVHYETAAAFIGGLRDNGQFQAFIGGWVFPFFIVGVFTFWLIEEDKERIPIQFILLPLFYIPFSIVGFTLVNAEFQFSYLYVCPLVILTFGYVYILFWVGVIALLTKFNIVR